MRIKTDLTYAGFIEELDAYYKNQVQPISSNIRYGQILYNCLWQVRPGIAESMNDTPIDPFYIDTKADIPPKTWEYIEQNW
jgi:hypothetical protein